MIQETPILKSKRCFPDTAQSIPRRIGQSLAESILKNRLTTLIAGPGYGKTTLAAQALEQIRARRVWLRLGQADRDVSTFFSGLVKGCQAVFPEFRSLDPETGQGGRPGHVPNETDFRCLLFELEKHLDQNLVLVLDDCHWVRGSEAVHAALAFFLQQASPAFHLVLISRASIPLPLSRLKAQGQVLELTSAELAFSQDEALRLCQDGFQATWDTDLIGRIQALTQGWVSGLTLFHYAFHDAGASGIRKFLDRSVPLPPAIAGYFEEEIFSPLAPDTQNFLVQTAILEPLDADFCDEFLGRRLSRCLLDDLASAHLFIHREGEAYVHHRLFRLFLREKLAASSPPSIPGLHGKAARLFQERGRIESALEHFLAAGDFKALACLLNTRGRRLFQEGKYAILKTCLDQTPDPYIDNYPWVLCLYGKVQGICGHPAEAILAYDRAMAEFSRQDKAEGICLCRIETALNHYIAGEFDKAAQGLEALLALSAISDELRIEALGYLTFLTAHFHHRETWQRYHDTCQSALAFLDSIPLNSRQKLWLDIYRGHTCIASGESQKAFDIGRSVEWRVGQQADLDDFFGHYGLLASAANALNRFEEGMAYARKGMACLAEQNSTLHFSVPVWQPAGLTPAGIRDRGRQDTTLPFMLFQAARSAFGLGNTQDSIDYARQSTALYRAMGARWGQALAMNVLCTAYARNGDLVLAEQSALSGLSLMEGLDLPLTAGTLAGNLAVILMMGERYEEALPLIRFSNTAFAPFGLGHWADLWLAMRHWGRDQETGWKEFLAVLTVHARKKNYCLTAERHWIVPYLVNIYARGHLQDYIYELLKIMGTDAVHDLKQILRQTRESSMKRAASGLLWQLPAPDPPGMRIFLLGRFRVFQGEREIRANDWGSQKILSLFQYLAFSRTRGHVNRDVLIEILWPDEDPGKTINRFHVTMTALRRVLEPGLPDGAPSAYISRAGDTYRLRLGSKGSVDMETFGDELARADREKAPVKAFGHRTKAVSVYGGELLAETPFCDWCALPRQDLQNQYLQALETLIAFHINNKDFQTSIRYAEKYLSCDRTAEHIYRDLMSLYAETGHLPRAAATFRRCREALHRELDCPVEPETEALARRLFPQGNSDSLP